MAFEYTPTNSGEAAGYACDFVEDPLELFKCRVCRLVLRDPHITECCGKYACHPCIGKEAENGGSCPIPGCGHPHVKINLNRGLRNEILESSVYCYSKEAGCEWTDKLDNLSRHHLNECQYVEVECQRQCGEFIQRRNVKSHEVVCQRFPVKCHQCGKVYLRHHLLTHMKACPYTNVKCPFNIVGCKSEVLVKDLSKHFRESLSQHFEFVEQQTQDVQAEVRETKRIVTQERNEKLATLSVEADAVCDEVVATLANVTKLKEQFEKVVKRFEEVQKKHDLMKVECDTQVSRKEITSFVIREDVERLKFDSKVKCYGPPLPRLRPSDIISRPLHSAIVSQEYIPPSTFMISNFDEERRKDACICLPPFFSHRCGYKMCLILYCNGYMSARGTSLSVFASPLRGKYDNYLCWPVNFEITYQVKNASQPRKFIHLYSHSRVYDESCISAYSNGFEGQNRYSLELHFVKPPMQLTPNGCLLIEVFNVQVNYGPQQS